MFGESGEKVGVTSVGVKFIKGGVTKGGRGKGCLLPVVKWCKMHTAFMGVVM